jgi:NAD-dependent dihydropyrimidine dehydrogenase PreA subunit
VAYVYVDEKKCTGCATCEKVCPTGAIAIVDGVATINQERCDGCETCLDFCPNGAILAVTEAVEGKTVLPRVQPRSPVASRRPVSPTIPLRTQLVPLVGSALVFLGREVVPRLIPRLVNALDRSTNKPTTTASRPPLVSNERGRGGRRFRKRRRGG